MNTARENCFWFDQCGSTCSGGCEYYYPVDDPLGITDADLAYYEQVLKENAEEYELLIKEYSEGEEMV